jgi:hypothetical protein
MKKCIHCGFKKPLSDFHKDKNRLDSHRSECKLCHNIQDKNNARKRKYGISNNEFLSLKSKQNGNCAICFNKLKPGIYSHLDHCHKTGKIRGILCNTCNRGLGYLQDSQDNLKSALKYLKKYS